MSKLHNILNSKIFVLDGAMGTTLQAHGIEGGECPERLNITRPELIAQIHKDYIAAGADIILANTFGANRIKLAEYGAENEINQINRAGVRIAKEAAGGNSLIACSIAPTGKFIEPIGDISFDIACDIYKEQITICIDAGADIIALESFGDIKEIRTALIAARELSDNIPILAMMTFQDDCRTVLGTSPESAAVVLDSLGADFIGANCSLGPDLLLAIIKRMREVSNKPLVVQPNAGMPELRDNITTYPAAPEYMAEYTEKFIGHGVGIIGGCCGTTHEHIKKIAQSAKTVNHAPSAPDKTGTLISSRTEVVKIGDGSITKRVGERINPTGKPYLIEELKNKKVSRALDMANSQVKDGADILDINVGGPGIDEPFMMYSVVMAVQRSVNVPFMLDSQDVQAIEAGLKAADGKVIVNSVTGERKKLTDVLPLVKKYGAAVLGLTLDEGGIPKTAEKRLEIAEKIIKAARKYGISSKDIIIDCLALTVSAEQDQVFSTLQAIRMIKKKYNVSAILGISNVSFGLPERSFLNAAFLSMAVEAGLDSAIINPSDALVSRSLDAANVLAGRDRRGERYVKRLKDKAESTSHNGDNSRDKIYKGIIQGDKDNIADMVEAALAENANPLDISNDILIPALREVGDLFEKKIFFLPQMILSAETMQAAFDRLKKETGIKAAGPGKGKIIMATVKGDIHDIGKNIVITMLKNYGYEVIDMGKNIPAEQIIDCAIKNNADIIGMSALMTTTMIEMEKVIKLIRKNSLSIPAIVGGAVVTAKYANSIGADAYAKDALDAVKKVKSLMLAEKGLAVLILAAGRGTRMKTDLPKVLNKLNGKPMLGYVIDTAEAAAPDKIVVIAGYRSEDVIAEFKDRDIDFIIQKEQLGTAHAVNQARDILKNFQGNIIVLSGDVPLLEAHSLLHLLDSHKRSGSKISMFTSHVDNPSGYGRIIRNDKNSIAAIKEEKDIGDSERMINEVNAGIYCFDKKVLFDKLSEIKNNNSQGEYYLTDIIEIAVRERIKINSVCISDSHEMFGINTREELEKANRFMVDNTMNHKRRSL